MEVDPIALLTRFATSIVRRAVIDTHKSFPDQGRIDGIQWIRTKGAILSFSDATRASLAGMIHKREEQERGKSKEHTGWGVFYLVN